MNIRDHLPLGLGRTAWPFLPARTQPVGRNKAQGRRIVCAKASPALAVVAALAFPVAGMAQSGAAGWTVAGMMGSGPGRRMMGRGYGRGMMGGQAPSGSTSAGAAQTLLHYIASKGFSCLSCHGVGVSRVGPSFDAIAAHYAGIPGGAKIVASAIDGGIPGKMPGLESPAESRQLARLILALPDSAR